MSARKNDTGKPPVHLVPPELILAAARAYAHGARIYGEWNYRLGLPHSRIFSALLRHLLAYALGETADRDSGLDPLDHAAAGLGMLIWTRLHRPDLKDFPCSTPTNARTDTPLISGTGTTPMSLPPSPAPTPAAVCPPPASSPPPTSSSAAPAFTAPTTGACPHRRLLVEAWRTCGVTVQCRQCGQVIVGEASGVDDVLRILAPSDVEVRRYDEDELP